MTCISKASGDAGKDVRVHSAWRLVGERPSQGAAVRSCYVFILLSPLESAAHLLRKANFMLVIVKHSLEGVCVDEQAEDLTQKSSECKGRGVRAPSGTHRGEALGPACPSRGGPSSADECGAR